MFSNPNGAAVNPEGQGGDTAVDPGSNLLSRLLGSLPVERSW